MILLSLPQADFEISNICLGTGGFGSDLPRDLAFQILDAFAEQGGNFVDSAHVYAAWLPDGAGASERTIGAWIKSRGMQGRLRVGTKGGHPDLETMHLSRLSPAEIARDLHESLDRLALDCIDLYWLHRDDPAVPVGEIMGTLNEHLAAGLIRAIGSSNWSPRRQAEANAYAAAHGLAGFCASQIGWSYARANEAVIGQSGILFMDDPTMRYHLQSAMPVVAFSAQAMGFFSGKYDREGQPVDLPATNPLVQHYFNPENFDRIRRARILAGERSCSPNQIALAYLLSQPFPACAIVGPRSVEQILASCAAADLRLAPAELAFLEGHPGDVAD